MCMQTLKPFFFPCDELELQVLHLHSCALFFWALGAEGLADDVKMLLYLQAGDLIYCVVKTTPPFYSDVQHVIVSPWSLNYLFEIVPT